MERSDGGGGGAKAAHVKGYTKLTSQPECRQKKQKRQINNNDKKRKRKNKAGVIAQHNNKKREHIIAAKNRPRRRRRQQATRRRATKIKTAGAPAAADKGSCCRGGKRANEEHCANCKYHDSLHLRSDSEAGKASWRGTCLRSAMNTALPKVQGCYFKTTFITFIYTKIRLKKQ